MRSDRPVAIGVSGLGPLGPDRIIGIVVLVLPAMGRMQIAKAWHSGDLALCGASRHCLSLKFKPRSSRKVFVQKFGLWHVVDSYSLRIVDNPAKLSFPLNALP